MSGDSEDHATTTNEPSLSMSSTAGLGSGGTPAAIGANSTTTIRQVEPCPHDEQDNPIEEPNRTWPQGIRREDNGRADSNQMVRSLRNGCYQHLMFLGVGGFVICNHCDHEILLVDPWTSYHSEWTRLIPGKDARPLKPMIEPVPETTDWDNRDGTVIDDHYQAYVENVQEQNRQRVSEAEHARSRLADLASFLRRSVSLGYHLTGILLSHMHFDHAEDIPVLLELLAADVNPTNGTYTDHRGLPFTLGDPAVRGDSLPRIYCDYDSIIYLLTYGFYMDYRNLQIDGGNDMINPPGIRVRRQPRYWFGNEALLDELNRRLRERFRQPIQDPDNPIPNPDNPINVTTDAWTHVKELYRFQPSATPNEQENKWYEITGGQGRLHYDDSYNLTLEDESTRCFAGQQGTPFEAGNYRVIPYVWDHSNTGCCWFGAKEAHRAQDDQTAGSLQRCSTFMISRNNVEGAKRTFLLGSGGKMAQGWTRHFEEPNIETDLLIQAILPRWMGLATLVASFRRQIHRYIEYMVKHITVREAAVFVHFEDFISRVPSLTEFADDFDGAVPYNLRWLWREVLQAENDSRETEDDESETGQAQAGNNQTDQTNNEDAQRRERLRCYRLLFERNRIYVMKRSGFECPFPLNARVLV